MSALAHPIRDWQLRYNSHISQEYKLCSSCSYCRPHGHHEAHAHLAHADEQSPFGLDDQKTASRQVPTSDPEMSIVCVIL